MKSLTCRFAAVVVCLIIYSSGALLTSTSTALADNTEAGKNAKAILITGASTGIGRHIAERLAADGYFVYAGARKQIDLDALTTDPGIFRHD